MDTNTDRFYVPSTDAMKRYAEMHLEDGGPCGTLAVSLLTMIDAYEYARLEELWERPVPPVTRRRYYRERVANLSALVMVAGPRDGWRRWRGAK